MEKRGIILSIAGFDPTGGAGILVDVKVFTLLGFKAGAIPTALTLQNTSLFQGWQGIDPNYFKNTLELIFSDLPVKGIKIGMIGTPENIEIIEYFLKKYRKNISWIVLDPVLKASLNYNLFSSSQYIEVLKKKILPFVDVITPNVTEAESLVKKEVRKKEDLYEIAKEIYNLGPKIIIITGYTKSQFVYDFFYNREKQFSLRKKKLNGIFHGTGCAFSSALLSYLVKGINPESAFKKAKNWLYLKLKKAEKEKLGGKLWLFL